MAKKYSRSEMLTYLRGIRQSGKRIVVAGAGSGLTGKSIEAGGADVIMVFNSGKYRMSGHGSLSGWLAFGNANEVAFDMGVHEVMPVIKEIPVICSCFGQDVTREIGSHLNRVMSENFSGINNFPTMGMVDGQFREQLELTNLGFQKEVDMVRIAREKDIFTIVYVFNEKESEAMAEAGADCIISHVGLTVGGMIGTTKSLTIQESAELTDKIMKAGQKINPDIIWLAHGGPLAAPKDFEAFVQYLPNIDGFVGASSMERIPTEEAIVKTVKEFKEV